NHTLRVPIETLLARAEPKIQDKLDKVGIDIISEKEQILLTLDWKKYSSVVDKHSGRKSIQTQFTCQQVQDLRKQFSDLHIGKMLQMSMSTYYRRIRRMNTVPDPLKQVTKF
ncbi:MAG: hypothetical protein ACI4M9_00410, partial [Succinivibrio sp.]